MTYEDPPLTYRFPHTKKEDREELAFFIAHDVLHVVHVEAELWVATVTAVD
jgi:hypothetical protein